MADLRELSDSTKRKLALQWSTLLDSKHLTGEHFQWHERERERLRRIAAQSPRPGPDWRNERAADETGIPQTVAVAEERFKALSGEYWRHWIASGKGYEAFVEWLEELKRNVSAEVASIWKGDSKNLARWYERACGPAIERTLSDLVKQGTNRARDAELKRLDAGGTQAGGKAERVPSIVSRLPKDALLRMEAETAAFMADYLPKVEREGNKSGPVHDAELLRELVMHQYGLVARECMAVCDSPDHFEAQMRADIARFVHFGLNQYRWLADAMRQELDTGFTFFVMRANPWAQIPEAERASAWHVGAITGEALTHLALKLRAEAFKNATEGSFPKPDEAGSTESRGSNPNGTCGEPTDHNADGGGQRAVIDAFISKIVDAGRRITRKDIWSVAGYKNATEFERFQRGDTRTTQSAKAAFNRVLSMTPENFIALLDKRLAPK